MSDNPYEPPKSSNLSDDQPGSDVFEGVLSLVISRSAGVRWELAKLSLMLWVPIILVGYFVFATDLDDSFLALVRRAAFVAVALTCTRVVSVLQTNTYLNHAREGSKRPWTFSIAFRSSLELIAPTILGGLLLGIVALSIGFSGIELGLLIIPILVWSFLAPFVLVAPGLWAAAPFWVDGSNLSEGWEQGQQLLKGNRVAALKPVLMSYSLAAAAVFFPPLLAVFNLVSKGVFVEAYLRR
jgi:hypothetical protein